MTPEATLICCSLPSSFQNFQRCENPWGMFFDFKENHGKHTLVLTQVLATSFPFFRSLEPVPLFQLFGPNKQGAVLQKGDNKLRIGVNSSIPSTLWLMKPCLEESVVNDPYNMVRNTEFPVTFPLINLKHLSESHPMIQARPYLIQFKC